MSADANTAAVTGVFSLLDKLDPMTAIVILVVVCAYAAQFWFARVDRLNSEQRYDGLVKQLKDDGERRHQDLLTAGEEKVKSNYAVAKALDSNTTITAALVNKAMTNGS